MPGLAISHFACPRGRTVGHKGWILGPEVPKGHPPGTVPAAAGEEQGSLVGIHQARNIIYNQDTMGSAFKAPGEL